jgi:tetratricopeptide (TPR) repeat protein
MAHGQRFKKNLSKDLCDCLKIEKNLNQSVDPQMAITQCFDVLSNKYKKDLLKAYGDDFFNTAQNNKAYEFGIEIGKMLAQNCDTYIELFIDESKKDNSEVAELLQKATAASQNHNYEEAVEHYSKVLKLEPENHRYFNYRGVAKFNLEDYYSAIIDFMKSIELQPDFYLSHYNLAHSKYRINDLAGAFKDLEISISLKNDYCESFNLKGLILDQNKDVDGALENFLAAYECDTSNSTFAFNVGYVYYLSKKDYEKCIEWLEIAVRKGNRFNRTYSYLGNAYNNMEEYAKAIEYHTINIMNSDSTEYVPFYNRGLTYFNNEDYDLSLKDFFMASQRDSSDSDIFLYMGKIEDKLGNKANAEKNYNKAIQLDTKNAILYDTRADFYERTGNYDSAIRDYTVSLSLYPNDCHILLALGKLQLHAGNTEKAMDAFKKSMDLGCEEASDYIK